MWTSARDGLMILADDRLMKIKGRRARLRNSLWNPTSAVCWQCRNFPPLRRTYFSYHILRGSTKRKHCCQSHTHTLEGGRLQCVWMCVCSGRCLVMSRQSFLLSELLRLTAPLNTHIFTQESWCGVCKFLRWCANTRSSKTSLHVFGLNKTEVVL